MGGKPRYKAALSSQTQKRDQINAAVFRACELFEPGGTVFNAAGFSKALCEITGLKRPLDGEIVRLILAGCTNVIFHESTGHFSRLTWRPI